MRIEAYKQIQQVYNTNNNKNIQKATKAKHKDELQLSELGKDIQTAKQAVASVPDIRGDVTAPIKARIQNDTYSVNGNSFADKLLKQYNEMR